MRNIGMGMIAAAWLVFLTTPLYAGSNEKTYPPIPDPDVIVQACHEAERDKFSSGVTSTMRQGGVNVARCLRRSIVENAIILTGGSERDRAEITERLREIHVSVGTLYWNLYNEPQSCFPACGTIHQLLHNDRLIELFETILRIAIDQRKKYGT